MASPFRTAWIFSQAWRSESAQIALDNEAIRLGQSDRALFNSIAAANRLVAEIEVIHDPVHLCARAPTPEVLECAAEDEALERTIQSIHRAAYAEAEALWAASTTRAWLVLARHFPQVARPFKIPIEEERCSLCGMPTAWEVSQSPIESHLYGYRPMKLEAHERLVGQSLRDGTRWDYEVRAHEGRE